MPIIDMPNADIRNDNNETKRSGADDSGMDETSFPIDEEAAAVTEINNCSICLEIHSPPLETLSCAHQFHEDCWGGWVATKARTSFAVELKIPCPLCRKPQTVERPSEIPLPQFRLRLSDADRADYDHNFLVRCFEVSVVVTASILIGIMYGFFRCALPSGYFTSCLQVHPYVGLEAIVVTFLTGIVAICCIRNCCDC